MNISFHILSEACRHAGMIQDGHRMCSFKNGKKAKSWSDWQECRQKNCCLVNPQLREPVDDQLDGQMSIEQYLEG